MRKSIDIDKPKPKKQYRGISQPATKRNKKQNEEESISYYHEEKNENKVSPLNDKSRFNVFIVIGLNKNYYNKGIISFYYGKDLKLDYIILNVNDNNKNISGELVLIQVELDELIDELTIKIKGGFKIKLQIPHVNNYFIFKNIGYGLGKESSILEVSEYIIFEEYLEYFSNKSKPAENIKIKQDLLKLLSTNECQKFLKNKNNISKLQKFCLKNKLKYNGNIIIKQDPEIMREIPITDASPEYMDNIKLIKDNKIIEHFINTENTEMEKKFYEIILKQIKKIMDLNSIFEIFPIEKINERFLPLIHKKIIEIKDTIPDDNIENVEELFNIFDNILYIYFNFNLENNLIDLLLSNIDIFHCYFKYLLNGQNKIKLKKEMIYFILDIEIEFEINDFEQSKNPNLLVDNLLNSENVYSEYILKKINVLNFNENDFYQKGISPKLSLYNAIIKKNNNLLNKFKNCEETYPNSISIIKKKILNDFIKGNKKININSILEYEKKIELIKSDEDDNLLSTKLKFYVKKCIIFFNNIDKILNYYQAFFPISKKEKVELVKQNIRNYKENKNIYQILNVDINKFFNEINFSLEKAIKESENIKYKKSNFFMLIYNYHYKKDASEETILKESIDDYNETFQNIIIKLESKSSLYKINNIDLIIKESLKPEFNIRNEIYFIKNEFSSLNKDEYIEKNFENDFKQFIEEYQFVEIIQGIIKLINYKNNKYDRYDKNKESYLFKNLREILNDIISKSLNEENVTKFFKSFTSNENYIKNENILIQFYKILFEKKESLSFLTDIEDSIKNKNIHSSFAQNEIQNLLCLYNYFKQLLNNEKIKSDKEIFYEVENNNNIKNLLNQLNDKYITYSKKQIESNDNRNLIVENFNKKDFFKIYFIYKGIKIIILGSLNEKMKNIINKFIEKAHTKRDSIYFVYSSKIVDEGLSLDQIANKEDKLRKEMAILVYSYSNDNQKNSIIKSKEVICPKCLGNINLIVENYKISLFNCKNNHSIKDLLFKDFLDSQNIDLKKIICNICNNNDKYNSNNNEFYMCLDCCKNLCVLCKEKHNKFHKIINYDKRNFICEIHLESYNSYCKSCKQNLCVRCEKEHENHEKINYGSILPDLDETQKRIIDLENSIKQLNANIDYIINRFESYKENLNNFLQIYKNIMKNVENQNRSYEMLNNMEKINDNDIMKDIKRIVEENNFKNKINIILDIIDKKENFDNNELTLIYKINKDDKEIKIFDSIFVQNNKNICKIKYENKEFKLTDYFKVDSNKEKLEIRLKGFKNIINANKMFFGCKALISIPDIIKINLSNLSDKSEMFDGCDQSLNIPVFLK